MINERFRMIRVEFQILLILTLSYFVIQKSCTFSLKQKPQDRPFTCSMV